MARSARSRALKRAADRFPELFGPRLAVARREAGLSQEELADKCGVGMRSVTRYEAGESLPDASVVLRLAAALDVDHNRLLCI